MRVYLLGEVRKVGFIELQGKTNIMQAVSMAEGSLDFATGRIVLVRNSSNNIAKRYSAILWDDVLDGKYLSDFKYLESGDTLSVTKIKSYEESICSRLIMLFVV